PPARAYADGSFDEQHPRVAKRLAIDDRRRCALRCRDRFLRGRRAETRAGDLRADARQARPAAHLDLLSGRPRRESESGALARLADAALRRHAPRTLGPRRARCSQARTLQRFSLVADGGQCRLELGLGRAVVLLERLHAFEEEVEIELPRKADAAMHLDGLATH